jgi:hypothetical protein
MGLYTKIEGLTQADRPVYQQAGSGTKRYIYTGYWEDQWVIGHNYTSDIITLQSPTIAAFCPDRATGWQAYNSDTDEWSDSYLISVQPKGAL